MNRKPCLAYFFSSFPRFSTTFLQREVRDLTANGLMVALFANRKPRGNEFDPQDRDLHKATFYLYPLDPIRLFRANLKLIVRRPKSYIRAVLLAMRLHDRFALQRWRNLVRLVGAAEMANQLSAREITHLHVHFAFGAAGVALLLKTLSGISYSLSIHGTDVLVPQPLIRQKLSQARFIISNCRYHIDFLKRKYPELSQQRFYHLPLGIALNRTPWCTAPEPAPAPPLRMLTVARFEPVKNHALLLNVLAEMKRKGIAFECRLAGDGSTQKAMKGLAAALQLNDSVHFLGAIGEKRVAEQMAWAHVVVLSSLSEGTPMTLIEAMAMGRAVVAPDITGIPEVVRHGQTGLLYPCGDQAQFVRCLEKLANDPACIAQFGKQARIRAEEQFDIALHTQRLIHIFQKEFNDDPSPADLRHHYTGA